MLSKVTFRLILIPVAIILHLCLVCGVGLILQSGAGLALKNGGNSPFQSELFLVSIETDKYSIKSDGKTYHGLPDSHDGSKYKDVFTLYPGVYCSGNKKKDGGYRINFCSTWGQQFFNLQGTWKKSGVDLVKNKLISNTPKLIFIGLLATASASILAMMGAFFAFSSFWGAVSAATFSWVGMISAIATAAMSNVFSHKLVKYIRNMKTSGSGELEAEIGTDFIRDVWIGCILPIVAGVILTIVSKKQYDEHKKQGRSILVVQNPLTGFVEKAKGLKNIKNWNPTKNKTSYKQVQDEAQGISFRELSPDLTLRHRSDTMSTEMEYRMFYGRDGQSRETAYEPMRHRSIA